MLLTSRMVRAARPREHRYVLADEHGMSLHVMPRGSKWWRFRYRFHQTERMISLGDYPHVDLATARRLHADARGLLARNIDPSADRKEKRAAAAHTIRSRGTRVAQTPGAARRKRSAGCRHAQRCHSHPRARHLSRPGHSPDRRHQRARNCYGCSKRLSSAPTSRSRLSGS